MCILAGKREEEGSFPHVRHSPGLVLGGALTPLLCVVVAMAAETDATVVKRRRGKVGRCLWKACGRSANSSTKRRKKVHCAACKGSWGLPPSTSQTGRRRHCVVKKKRCCYGNWRVGDGASFNSSLRLLVGGPLWGEDEELPAECFFAVGRLGGGWRECKRGASCPDALFRRPKYFLFCLAKTFLLWCVVRQHNSRNPIRDWSSCLQAGRFH